MMTTKQRAQLLRYARKTVRFFGYRCATIIADDLVTYFFKRMKPKYPEQEFHGEDVAEIIASIPDGKRFHTVEYARQETEEYRRKDLYYYNPTNEKTFVVNSFGQKEICKSQIAFTPESTYGTSPFLLNTQDIVFIKSSDQVDMEHSFSPNDFQRDGKGNK